MDINVKDVKEYLDGRVVIKIRSKFPAGQGYSPRIIRENHFSVDLNGSIMNLPESALRVLIEAIDYKKEDLEKIVEVEKIVEKEVVKEVLIELNEDQYLVKLKDEFQKKFNKDVPVNKINDKNWILNKING